MSRYAWDPVIYGRYADERSRPFFDLVPRIAAESPGDDAVLAWITGTALRPMLDRLDPAEATGFLADRAAPRHEAYPRGPYGTVFPFRRIFAVARKPGGERTGFPAG